MQPHSVNPLMSSLFSENGMTISMDRDRARMGNIWMPQGVPAIISRTACDHPAAEIGGNVALQHRFMVLSFDLFHYFSIRDDLHTSQRKARVGMQPRRE